MIDKPRKPCKPSQRDLEQVVGHFLYYLSNEPGKYGISPRRRFYGQLPVQARMLFPDLDDEIIITAVREQLALTRKQRDILPNSPGNWRSYS